MKKLILTITGAAFLSAVLFFFASVVNAQTCVQPPPGLVSWWPGDADASDIADGNDGSLQNATTFSAGKVNQGFSLDGIDDYIDVGSGANLDFDRTDPFSIDAWIKIDNAQNQLIVSKQGSQNSFRGIAFFVRSNNKLAMSINSSFSSDCIFMETIAALTNNTFHHVAATYDGSSIDAGIVLYVDGVDQNTVNPFCPSSVTGTIKNSSNWSIGARNVSGSSLAFAGVIDEVEIFNRALSDGEIQAIFDADSAGKCKAVNVAIDIKPGSDPNCFNINGHGVIPVAILGSDTFDVTNIDQGSLRFGGLEVRVRGKKGPLCNVDYSDSDAYLDLVCHFEDDADNWDPGDGEATLTGRLFDGTEFEGTDSICVVP